MPVLLTLLLVAAGLPAASAQAAEKPRAHARLIEEGRSDPEKAVRVIVLRQGRDRAADRRVEAKGRRKLKDVGEVGFVAEMRAKDIADLGRDPSVRYVTVDAPVERTAVDPSLLGAIPGQAAYPRVIGAASRWGANVTGKGVGVAVIDTGINSALPDFGNGAGGGRVVARQVFAATAPTTLDGVGHGTHVAGIIGGNAWHRGNSPAKGKHIGVAPEANLIDLRVSDELGLAYMSDVINAVEWAIANRQTYNIRVLNLSLISTVPESATTSPLAAAVERAWFNGIFVVVAAGNQGPNTASFAPANDPFVLAVGAADSMGTVAQGDDTVATWSSYGTSQDGYVRPDVVAPGRWIAAPLASAGSTFATSYPDRVVDANYIWMSGTSMASPVVAGVAALLFQARPELTNDAAKWLLMNTATPLPVAGSGRGEVDINAALSHTGPIGVANNGLPISQLLTGLNGATTYTTSSWTTSSWTTSSWTTSSWTTSSWTTSSWTATTPQVSPWTRADVE